MFKELNQIIKFNHYHKINVVVVSNKIKKNNFFAIPFVGIFCVKHAGKKNIHTNANILYVKL